MTRKTRADGIKDLQGLLDRCVPDREKGCMVWAGARKGNSGTAWLSGRGAVTLPAAYGWCIGQPAPKGRLWVAMCGNQLCLAPEHRRLRDRSTLQLMLRPELPPLHRAKIAVTKRKAGVYSRDVHDRIMSFGGPARVIAAELGVSVSHVCRIRTGEAWRLGSGSAFEGLRA